MFLKFSVSFVHFVPFSSDLVHRRVGFVMGSSFLLNEFFDVFELHINVISFPFVQTMILFSNKSNYKRVQWQIFNLELQQ